MAVLSPWFAPVLGIQLAAAVRKACVRQRLANSILNLFSLCGLALRSAASAAWRKLASFASLPASAASASGERHGFVPTPPRAIRARVILPLAIVITTAAELSANSYDARSRSFKYRCLLPTTGGGSETWV